MKFMHRNGKKYLDWEKIPTEIKKLIEVQDE